MTSLTFGPKGNLVVSAPLTFRMALETEGRDFIGEMVFKVRAVGFVAVVTALLGCGMIVPGVHYPCVTLKAANGIHRSGSMGIMAALAFCIAYWCVLIFVFDDIHMARCAGGSQC